ncbi:Polyketide cyclase / dehydrase and lipid transport [Geodermatophilus amargosae]|uniref:Polyketide cyclase / dehydrase and lipid transport n=1 Tax=Geodermatophilus amargosae TaxID=1296565 RepID=A0A1I7D741_9ACTN|nr:SRPBCC family protein [Geodermatophilus amargosae]SFU07469.1 Polyketide cyclase / dehydrase and lipid transport [Geodermatophilus amargosae]
MDIDPDAPVQATRSVAIAAAPSLVWAVLADIQSWPNWNTDVRDVSVPNEVRPSATFSWRSGPGRITSTIAVVEPERELSWTGRTLGIHAVHVYRLQPWRGGTTAVLEESWTGLPTRLLRRRCQAMLNDALDSGLTRLKSAVENRSAAP